MAYSVVPTVITGDSWTAGNQNTYVRDNFKAGIPDIFTAAGDMAYGTAANTAGVLSLGNPHEIVAVNAGANAITNYNGFSGCLLSGATFSNPQYTISFPIPGGGSLSTGYYRANFTSSVFETEDYWDIGNPDAIIIPRDGVYQLDLTMVDSSTSSSYFRVFIGPVPRILISTGTYVGKAHNACYVNRFTAGDDIYVGIGTGFTYSTMTVNIQYAIRYLDGLG